VFRQLAWRFGVCAPHARLLRARQERRLGALAEQAGDREAAIFHYRLALASYVRVGVKSHLAGLASHGPAASTSPQPGPTRVRHRLACTQASHDSTRLLAARERSCVGGHAARSHTRRHEMKGRIQIVGRLPVDLNRRVRAAAKQRKVSLNTFLIEALTHALGIPPRVAESKGAR
jgi:hypothetical protein